VWKASKEPFRPGMKSGRKTFEERQEARKALEAMKAREQELIDEKAAKRKVLPRV
jgi:hypothetical protein